MKKSSLFKWRKFYAHLKVGLWFGIYIFLLTNAWEIHELWQQNNVQLKKKHNLMAANIKCFTV